MSKQTIQERFAYARREWRRWRSYVKDMGGRSARFDAYAKLTVKHWRDEMTACAMERAATSIFPSTGIFT